MYILPRLADDFHVIRVARSDAAIIELSPSIVYFMH